MKGWHKILDHDAALKRDDFYHVDYFECGEAFYGSLGMMRYRISRRPQKNVRFDHSPDKNKEAFLECVIWRGPLAWAKTREEKTTECFSFDEEGAQAMTDWLNEMYRAKYAHAGA